ncbi:MAG TPA: hypothetical protein VLL52_08380 [Anaerolineae bacterium]|nr:hypothetical protein [Anaerolineae bacterium]
MGGLFNRLQDQLNERETKQSGGVSAVDLLVLPTYQRRVMRLLLRHGHLTTYDQLWTLVQELPENQQFSKEELDEAIAQLVSERWLFRVGEEKVISYRVNLRRKAASQLGGGIWGAIDSKIAQRIAKATGSDSTDETPSNDDDTPSDDADDETSS